MQTLAILIRTFSSNELINVVSLQKAFDSVYLNGLWHKLLILGINAKMLRIIRDMYNNVKTCVRSCRSYSDFFECAVGLKQGRSFHRYCLLCLLRI